MVRAVDWCTLKSTYGSGEIVRDIVVGSRVIRRGDLIAHLPRHSGSPRENEEPYINSPVLEAVRVARRLQAGAEEQTANFSPVIR